MYRPNSLWTWSFTGVTLVQAAISLALEGYIFANFQLHLQGDWEHAGGSEVRTIPTYLSLLIFAFVYQIWLVYDALSKKNTIQIIGLCLMNLGILVYTAIQIDQIKDAVGALTLKNMIEPGYWQIVKPYLDALPCIIALGSVCLSFIAWKLYDEFAWTIYKQISADLRMKRRYLVYQIYIALLKFDFFIFLAFEVQFLAIVPNTKSVESAITIATLPITILLLILAAWSVKRENIYGMVATMFVYVVALGYFIFKLVRIYNSDPARKKDYSAASRTLTVFAALAIALMVVTIKIAVWCTLNFNKGLKVHVSKTARRNQAENESKLFSMNDVHGSHDQGSHHAGRMEID